ncbi:hypothetical protein C5N14_09975 [Micromonospora sp. MW-13]|uniref:DUF2267 domain-containing protein n=1 Tax=Micromonospora sp. MW-13 TaxID=2094022 RepID=UPI000E44F01E|nr:DUF2267 domain-containing protein [Micromonospora sp. MW-13]RGC69082.1 hypothetical protein C5N14_09975 [Micromonospora sp. MW-13]
MRFPRFVDAVSRRAGVSPAEAAAVTRAVLGMLAQRVEGGPERGVEASDGSAEDFLSRVGVRAGVDPETARAGAEAVFATLRETITVGEFRELVTRHPDGCDGAVDPAESPYDN